MLASTSSGGGILQANPHRICTVSLVLAIACGQWAIGQDQAAVRTATGRVVGRLQVEGQIPKPSPIPVSPRIVSRFRSTDFAWPDDLQATLKVPNESLRVSREGGLANAIVYLKTPPAGYVAAAAPIEPIVVTNERLRFSPRIATMRAGQPVVFKNADKEPTNFHMDCVRNNPVNMVVNAEDQKRIRDDQIQQAESLPMTIRSDIHPWKPWARLLPLAHPFAAVSDAEGRFEITDLPAGQHDFVVWHERAGYLEKKFSVVVEQNAQKSLELKFDIGRFQPEQINEGRTFQWDGAGGLTAGVAWESGESEYTKRSPDIGPRFRYLLKNQTDQPVTMTVPETFSWDLGILSRRQLNVRIHDRGESQVTVAAKETKVLDVPNPLLNVADLERGYWQVVFSTPINDSRLTLDLWLDGQDAAWSSTRNADA